MTDLDPTFSDEQMELIARPRQLTRIAIIVATICIVAFVAVGIFLKRSELGTTFTTSDQVGIAGIGLVLAAGALLFTRPRVWANSERIRVRNVFTTSTLPWGVIRDVGVSDGSAWGLLDLQDDDQISMLGLQVADGQRSVEAIKKLRRLHAAAVGPAQGETGQDR
ncbi:PH (Pleckstrin Homology) domain-containing protein [Antricoccus suffuscus]|uniref:PH (Pleckstrin Homology) domain-containing protein n=1 Tax=Antricoccus suffuscus TaxID=1629062 RepID=A0A2T0ZWF1_9ACTN|nr:PH domain-containing protein [Antricoccus suffuscus]PRZ40670.1 PH (Pleckstrin Homology) domain-containing protein [Antricoccus suffuscus]